jgi:hypothetical protein
MSVRAEVEHSSLRSRLSTWLRTVFGLRAGSFASAIVAAAEKIQSLATRTIKNAR